MAHIEIIYMPTIRSIRIRASPFFFVPDVGVGEVGSGGAIAVKLSITFSITVNCTSPPRNFSNNVKSEHLRAGSYNFSSNLNVMSKSKIS